MNVLKKGDQVVMHTCMESKKYDGKVWTCKTDEFTSSSGTPVIFLEGFSGYFAAKFLQKVNIEHLQIKLNSIRFYLESPISAEEARERIEHVLNDPNHDGI